MAEEQSDLENKSSDKRAQRAQQTFSSTASSDADDEEQISSNKDKIPMSETHSSQILEPVVPPVGNLETGK